MMASKIDVLIKQALKTFQKKPFRRFEANLQQLQTLVDGILLKDLNIPRYLLENDDSSSFSSVFSSPSTNSVEYFEVYQGNDVTIGVFILKDGAKIPLHDHPSMYGILKVLQGAIKISSYSVLRIDSEPSNSNNDNNYYYKHPLEAVKHPDVAVHENENSCLLTPDERNIHEITCIRGPASFLDVLSPPYEEDYASHPRSCHYFQEIERLEGSDTEMVKLIQISPPSNFCV